MTGTLSLSGPCSVPPLLRRGRSGVDEGEWAFLAWGTREAADRRAKRRAAVVVAEGKTRELVEDDFRTASRRTAHCQHCVQWGRRAADLHQGCCRSVEAIL